MASIADDLNRAFVLHRQEQWDAAEDAYRKFLTEHSSSPDGWHMLGVLLFQRNRFTESVAPLSRAVELAPNVASYYVTLGQAAQAVGRYEAALLSFRQAIQLGGETADLLIHLAEAQHAAQQLEAAVESFQRALAIRPDAHANNGLGLTLLTLGRAFDATAPLEAAIALSPDWSVAHSNLGVAYQEQERFEDAVRCFQRALQLAPEVAETWNNLGNAQKSLGLSRDAASSFRRALELRADYADARLNLGTACEDLGDYAQAHDCFQQAVLLQPDDAPSHVNLALSLLRDGSFAQGWAEYEWRRKTSRIPQRNFAQPEWDGTPQPAQTLLLHAEQGLGDTIQFVRLAAVARQHVGRVILECQRPLKRLLATFAGVDELVAEGDPLPAFDCHAPLLSLPYKLGLTLATIPNRTPYLSADPQLIDHWRSRLPTREKLRIGINWAGRAGRGWWRFRNIPLAEFAVLAELPGVALVSLQRDAGLHELQSQASAFSLLEFGDDLDGAHGPFMDTAAIMSQLDLVITSDTAVPHLAGALGVPVWVALPFAADWRFLRERHESPWYPSMRLFRQKSPGDWSSVFHEIKMALTDLFLR